MHIVFLDIDNVLNYGFSGKTENDMYGFSDKLVENLKYILNSINDSKIVISSSWRLTDKMDHISITEKWIDILEEKIGIPNCIIGSIGVKNEYPNAFLSGDECNMDPLNGKGRGNDIAEWLNSHNNIGTFVILDDNISCGNIPKLFPNNYIDCSLNGLTKEKAKAAIWILTNFGREKDMEENIFLVSDTHFWHGNIIKYCNRPWNNGKDAMGNIIVDNNCIEKMNDDLIKNWNSIVSKDSIVYHLGDFCLGPNQKEHIPDIVSKLNGKICLIMGNHDHNSVKFYYDAGFYRVYDRPILIKDFFILSHAPIQWIKDGSVYGNCYGHVHNQEMYKHYTSNTFNCCVEVNDYKPIRLSDIIKKCQSYN